MSFDPSNPERPRSTPIPGGSSSFDLPPPTPAEFLGEQRSPFEQPQPSPPFGQQPPPFGQQGFPTSFQVGGSSGGNPFRWIPWISFLVTLGVLAGVGWTVYRAIDDANDARDDFPRPTFDPVTIPSISFPEITFPEITFPEITVAPVPPVTVPPASTVVASVVEELPTTAATVATVATPPSILPGGIGSLFDDTAARQVIDLLDADVGGAPSRFVSILLDADTAVGVAQDPASPDQPTVRQWEAGAFVPFNGSVTVSTDFDAEGFTAGDVNWEAVAGLAKLAPAYAGVPDAQVVSIAADRIGSGNPPPVLFEVIVADATGAQHYVEATATGELIGAGPCPAPQCPGS